MIHYSRGTHTFDAYPLQREARTFTEFFEAVLNDYSERKGRTYVSGPFKANGDGRHHRCKADALPRAFLPFDVDGMEDSEAWADLLLALNKYSGCGYTTSSHTPEKPRMRFILAASRETDREEGVRACEALQQHIDAALGAGRLKWDATVYRSEQPLYTPVTGATVYRFDGAAVNIDELLAESPAAREPEHLFRADGNSDPVLKRLTERSMVKRDLRNGKLAVTCPFEAEHTEETSDSSTVYMLPNYGGVRYGKFSCLHAHCAKREQEEFLQALDLDPRRVWAEQANPARASINAQTGDELNPPDRCSGPH